MNITYKFELQQRVITDLGEGGKVTVCGYDETGIIYYVKTPGGGNWYKESELSV